MNIRSSFRRMTRAFAAAKLKMAALVPAGGVLALFLAMAGNAVQAETLLITISGPDYPQSFLVNTSDSLISSDADYLLLPERDPASSGGGKASKDPVKQPEKQTGFGIEFGDRAVGGGVIFGALDFVSGSPDGPIYTIDPILVSLSFGGRGIFGSPGSTLKFLPGTTFTSSSGKVKNGVTVGETITVTAIPETSTWAMMLAGFAGMGLWTAAWKKRPRHGLGAIAPQRRALSIE